MCITDVCKLYANNIIAEGAGTVIDFSVLGWDVPELTPSGYQEKTVC